ncbi:AfsR/SARP family transcriptional regulator [Myceligenerans xiligouense]|uniref:AfsR/SARP family transcriptional regulator n=1 Tax=Myceligenerans xiligouense TaxID=253184 RepID=UPI001B87F4BE|nr:AfsR/SARP family transcriptional regulator [Myceligenerans xiligouense]
MLPIQRGPLASVALAQSDGAPRSRVEEGQEFMPQADSSSCARVTFSVLGPLAARVGESQISVGGPVQRRVLAMLLLEPGRVVPLDRLVDAVWDEDPPSTAAHQVRKAAASLRKRIPCGHDLIVTDDPGYRIDASRCGIDLLDFDTRTRAARGSLQEGDPEAAVAGLRSALGLWRGSVLSGIDTPVIRAAATVLDERRISAMEQVFELSLSLDQCNAIIPELRAFVAEDPLRETPRAQLMTALYRTGRQADALEEFRRLRELLQGTLGIDPGTRLNDLYAAILNSDPALGEPTAPVSIREPAEAEAADVDGAQPVVRARTLPASLRDFTGRGEELAQLQDLMAADGEPDSRQPRVIAIVGMGGVGKTSLAIEAAHRVSGRYPDGRLWVDLRGFTPGQTPLSPRESLDILLHAAGFPDDRIPDNLEARAGLWQSYLADRRVLILLDNVASPQQVQHLLPVPPGCVVLVTSRSRLVDLDGAVWVSVGHMSPAESVALINEIVPAPGAPQDLERLADLCGHLPLALRIAAARIASRPGWTVRYMADRLDKQSRRLAELRSDERSVAATLHLSYAAMPEAHQVAFALLGMHPGETMDLPSVAALLGMDVLDAEDILDALVDANLLEQRTAGVYALHDLVRNFAHGIGRDRDEGTLAVDSLLDYYVRATDEACDVLFPGRARRFDAHVPDVGETPALEKPEQAAAWFEREDRCLVSLVATALERGRNWQAVILARNLNFHLNARGCLDDLRELGVQAVEAARRLDEPVALCVTLSNLSSAGWKLGRVDESLQAATEAHRLAIRVGDRGIEAHSGLIIGLLMTNFGQYDEALPTLGRAIALAREIPNRRTEAECLTTLSTLHERQGRYDAAAAFAREAITASRAIGYQDNELVALADLALAQIGLASWAEARRTLEQARDLCEETSSRGDVSLVEVLSATVEDRLGSEADARELAAGALRRARSSDSCARLVRVTNLVAALHAGWGEHAEARTLYRAARESATAMRFHAEEVTARRGLALVAEVLGEDDVADGEPGADVARGRKA